MQIKDYLAKKAALIKEALLEFLQKQEQETKAFDFDILFFLKKYLVSGKVYRGALVFLGYDLFSSTKSDQLSTKQHLVLLDTSLALELAHGAFLLQDDVIDQDDKRRGQDAFHALIMKKSQSQDLPSPRHLGYSQAICLANILIFWADQLLHKASLQADQSQIFPYYAESMIKTWWGQMDDIYLAALPQNVDEELISHVLSFKSGHYSLVNPLILGAKLAGANRLQQDILEKFALNLGIVFQIKDDELGLFGDEVKLGKPVGSDIKENKKTLQRHFLFKLAKDQDKQRLKKIFGSSQLSAKELTFVRQKISQYQVLDEVNEQVKTLKQEAEQALARLEIQQSKKFLLQQLQQLLQQRKK